MEGELKSVLYFCITSQFHFQLLERNLEETKGQASPVPSQYFSPAFKESRIWVIQIHLFFPIHTSPIDFTRVSWKPSSWLSGHGHEPVKISWSPGQTEDSLSRVYHVECTHWSWKHGFRATQTLLQVILGCLIHSMHALFTLWLHEGVKTSSWISGVPPCTHSFSAWIHDSLKMTAITWTECLVSSCFFKNFNWRETVHPKTPGFGPLLHTFEIWLLCLV